MNEILSFLVSELEKKGTLPGADTESRMKYRYLDLGHVDSLSIISFVSSIEIRFDVEIDPEDMESEAFRTLGGLVGIIEQKLMERDGK